MVQLDGRAWLVAEKDGMAFRNLVVGLLLLGTTEEIGHLLRIDFESRGRQAAGDIIAVLADMVRLTEVGEALIRSLDYRVFVRGRTSNRH